MRILGVPLRWDICVAMDERNTYSLWRVICSPQLFVVEGRLLPKGGKVENPMAVQQRVAINCTYQISFIERAGCKQ